MQLGKAKFAAIIAIVAIINFLLGGGLMYLIDTTWIYDRVHERKEYIETGLKLCAESLDISNRLTKNCTNAYNLARLCVVNIDSCDLYQSTNDLRNLNIQRSLLQTQLNIQTQELEPFTKKLEPL